MDKQKLKTKYKDENDTKMKNNTRNTRIREIFVQSSQHFSIRGSTRITRESFKDAHKHITRETVNLEKCKHKK